MKKLVLGSLVKGSALGAPYIHYRHQGYLANTRRYGGKWIIELTTAHKRNYMRQAWVGVSKKYKTRGSGMFKKMARIKILAEPQGNISRYSYKVTKRETPTGVQVGNVWITKVAKKAKK